jgi:hypothetical protein
MPTGNVSLQAVLAVIGIASTLTTAVFWGAYLLGKYIARLESVENTVTRHEEDIRVLKGLGV